ncbi:MAG: STAS domain-containing protein [Anaerohalosphaera sp.]|nr:STAS domain-containing protein [Anaerohalosphaera sp.]
MVHTNYTIGDGSLKLSIEGRLDAATVSLIWTEAIKKLSKIKPLLLEIDASGVEYCDGAGAALILHLKQRQEKENRQCDVIGLKTEFEKILNIFDPGHNSEFLTERFSIKNSLERAGELCCRIWGNFRIQLSFLGELLVK